MWTACAKIHVQLRFDNESFPAHSRYRCCLLRGTQDNLSKKHDVALPAYQSQLQQLNSGSEVVQIAEQLKSEQAAASSSAQQRQDCSMRGDDDSHRVHTQVRVECPNTRSHDSSPCAHVTSKERLHCVAAHSRPGKAPAHHPNGPRGLEQQTMLPHIAGPASRINRNKFVDTGSA